MPRRQRVISKSVSLTNLIKSPKSHPSSRHIPLYKQYKENDIYYKNINKIRPKSAIQPKRKHDRSWYFDNIVPNNQTIINNTNNNKINIDQQLSGDIAIVSSIPSLYKSEFSGRILYTKHPVKKKSIKHIKR